MTVWLTLIAAGVAGYVVRVLPLAVSLRGPAPEPVRRYLDALPVAVIAALAAAGVALPDSTPTRGAEIGAAVVALAVTAWRRDLLLAVVSGIAAVALLRALGM